MAGNGVVWKPSEMVLADEDILMNWDVTSDSLAAWLAVKLNAQHLVLVKSDLSRYQHQTEISVDALARDHLVDPCFATYLNGQVFNTWIMDKKDDGVLKQGVDFDKGPLAALKVRGGIVYQRQKGGHDTIYTACHVYPLLFKCPGF